MRTVRSLFFPSAPPTGYVSTTTIAVAYADRTRPPSRSRSLCPCLIWWQVVLPMLVDEVVDPGWLTERQFYQGFALVQVTLDLALGPLPSFR